MLLGQKSRSIRYQFGLLAALAIGLIATITTQASAQTLEVNGSGILTGVDGVVVDGSNYNVTFVPGSCVSDFNGCTSSSDFTFGAGAAFVASSELGSILSGGTVNAAFPNGVVNEFAFGSPSAQINIFTPYGTPASGNVSIDIDFTAVGGVVFDPGQTAGISISYGPNSGGVYADFTPTAVPEPDTLFLFGAGLLGFGALRRRHKAMSAINR